MPFITNYQRNESENGKEVSSSHTSQNDHVLKALKQMLERVWKKGTSSAVGETVNWYSHYGELYRLSLKH